MAHSKIWTMYGISGLFHWTGTAPVLDCSVVVLKYYNLMTVLLEYIDLNWMAFEYY